MAKLRLGAVLDDRPVKLTVELPAAVHRDLVAYAEVLGRETGQRVEAVRLIAPMLTRFMATDRGFATARRSRDAHLDAAKPSRPTTTDAHSESGEED